MHLYKKIIPLQNRILNTFNSFLPISLLSDLDKPLKFSLPVVCVLLRWEVLQYPEAMAVFKTHHLVFLFHCLSSGYPHTLPVQQQ